MGAPAVLPGGDAAPGWPVIPGLAPAVSTVDSERYTELRQRLTELVRAAVDVDEVAAHLEAGGINDRIALREYGEESVFALAARLRADIGTGPAAAAPAAGRTDGFVELVVTTLVRAALYLTPAVVAVGGAEWFVGLPAPAGAGALIFGWATGQALAFLGYRALGGAGPARAARLLAGGFGVAAAGWVALMLMLGVTEPWPHVVALGQLALFAATGVALVTGQETRVLVAASTVWFATLALSHGAGLLGLWLLAFGVLVVVIVAFAPAFGTAARFRPAPGEAGSALAHGAVGAGQAVLFASVVLAGSDPALVPAAAVPLLVGVPVAELVLIWHQRRVAGTRAALTDRRVYVRRLTKVALATVAVLAAPVVAGCVLTVAGTGRFAAGVLVTGVFALCLVLVAHRRLGLAGLLVWWPAVLVGVLYRAVPGAERSFVDTLVAIVLIAVCLPALGVVTMVLRDRWSYR
ncbi:hypothetical protein Val02_45580 [Virgisporangium aliadipatigenens]|uniref:Uncharacterized protein n=1 Tax=Virgisporangium aliadipatigenens TaxID=741659 RepID=A0A8J3YNH5_9ACTN|nr:hypothetical protein [Virgisporangium aliadipatigenens]GIJ47672.1 hypothetical protein Val02_45580 [Virgisporangium aliadipatigenens]